MAQNYTESQIRQIVENVIKGVAGEKAAAASTAAYTSTEYKGRKLIGIYADMNDAIDAAEKKNIKDIGATGGVFYNEAITNAVKNRITQNGFNFIQHTNTCAGDGSVSLGQAIIAKKI